ncbi:CRISPR-associated endonuclease Cas1 [Neiella sp. HB171785]|uniref:CRISPR-associated endonuclease Cas1 n=1 Tax=Neiella litorisoli TaxID=2771431 RepID=A0A8J6QGX2_9GAMM|nr:CRISPR-associated endonuclease Cas1 [Neiella litorisoli]MBD1389285.1 CRISPR-associated endonuclease Cas1 [Neiella litorisoli]
MISLNSCITSAALSAAFERVAENNGAPGIDGMSIRQFRQHQERYLGQLQQDLVAKSWQPSALKCISIAKANGSERKLAIPTVRDRVVHTAIAQALVPLWESEFERCSDGYRPGLSYMDAIKRLEQLRDQGYLYVVDADIKSYFDHIDHAVLTHQIKQLIKDEALAKLILHAAFTPQRLPQSSKSPAFGVAFGKGVAQGSSLSPLLSNLYLDPLDEALLDCGFEAIRYADDFVVMCQTAQGSQLALEVVRAQVASLQLQLNEAKTQLTDFNKGFTFLGMGFVENLVMPMSEHSERAWLNTPIDPPSESDEPLEANEAEVEPRVVFDEFAWSTKLGAQQAQLQQYVLEQQADIKQSTQSGLSRSQVARLRSVYIKRQGAVLALNQGQFVIKNKGECLQKVPSSTVDLIYLFGAIHPTLAVIRFCFEQQIPLIFMTQSGQWLGALGYSHHADPKIIRAQANDSMNNQTALSHSRFFVHQKVNNQLYLLNRWKKYGLPVDQSALNCIRQARNSLREASAIEQLRGYEGIAGRHYFGQLKCWLGKTWQFTGRNRQPPRDPVNAMLSYGYQLLYHNIHALIVVRGLEPKFGYLHQQRSGFASLALDVMEPWRAFVVDEIVLKLVLRQHLTSNQFQTSSSGCNMSKEARKMFVGAFEQRMQQQFSHPILKIKTDIRRFMDLQILELRNLIATGEGKLTPLRLR